MPKLNVLIALKPGLETQGTEALVNIAQSWKERRGLDGLTKKYSLLSEDVATSGSSPERSGPGYGRTVKQPDQLKRVEITVPQMLERLVEDLTRWFDVEAAIERGNTQANADVVVDGKTLLKNVPVNYLIFLEKRLAIIDRALSLVPILDASEEWKWDESQGYYSTASPVETTSTRKTKEPLLLAAPTKEHPAQVTTIDVDVPEGKWTQHKHSGALQAPRARELQERCRTLIRVVKAAREEANSIVAQDEKYGATLLGYLFG